MGVLLVGIADLISVILNLLTMMMVLLELQKISLSGLCFDKSVRLWASIGTNFESRV